MRVAHCLFVFVALVPGATPSYADCDDLDAVWSATSDTTEVHLDITSFVGWSPKIQLEGWEGGNMLWTLDGSINCSNGVYACFLDLPMSDGTSVEADVEVIPQREGLTEYFVFAHLTQTAYQAQRMEGVALAVTRTDGKAASDPIKLPSIYKFLRCN